MTIICFILLSLFLNPVSSTEDTSTGSICGTVTDTNGNPLIGATVMIIGTSTGAMTDRSGSYNILDITPGSYSLQANMVGMSCEVIEGVYVNIGTSVVADFILEPISISTREIRIIIEI